MLQPSTGTQASSTVSPSTKHLVDHATTIASISSIGLGVGTVAGAGLLLASGSVIALPIATVVGTLVGAGVGITVWHRRETAKPA